MFRLAVALTAAMMVIVGCASNEMPISPSCSEQPTSAAPTANASRAGGVSHAANHATHGYELSASAATRSDDLDPSRQKAASAYVGATPLGAFGDEVPEQPAPAPSSTVRVLLPSTLYLVTGQKYWLDLTRVILGYQSNMRIESAGPEGSDFDGRAWSFKPKNAGKSELAITVKDQQDHILTALSRPVEVFEPGTGINLRHLSIGDSITRAGGYTDLAIRCVLGGKSVGTRTYDNGTIAMEGRGGWTLQRYTARIAQPTGGDSPFVFPRGVAGNRFRGNTAFWRDVTATDPKGYSYSGFQMIARQWRTSGPFDYDPNGYPTSPTRGDVVVDPMQPAGIQWRWYDGSVWSPMEPQPNTEVSFSKYVQRYNAAFSAGSPTSVSIMLGTVDFLSTPPEELWPLFKQRLDRLIASIREWNAKVPIILIGSPSGGPQSFWTSSKQAVTATEFNRRMAEFTDRLYAAYDSQQSRDRDVYVISFLGTVAEDNMADYVHPKMPAGHAQMAPWLAGAVAHLIASGKV